MNNVTDKLRRMLDERGIEWTSHGAKNHTWYDANGGARVTAYVIDAGHIRIRMCGLTPEQAIAATVGAGTCHMEVHDNLAETEGMGEAWLECDECHWQMQLEPSTPRFKFCPNCGRRKR
ncbi:MAG: hypothetical protein IKF14_13645 [Atopobiaceae bacterium]|nr:hypothetical protein [Atopobiaceae bacterium]MBR3160122.1 hypothetical protein [Atopobiaceae bacterium]